MKVALDGRVIEELNFYYFKKELEHKAEQSARAEKINELVSEGIDRQMAADMVDCGLV